jgi:hypothetical protein
MARSALQQGQDHMLKRHSNTIPPQGRHRTLRRVVCKLNSQVAGYPGLVWSGMIGS